MNNTVKIAYRVANQKILAFRFYIVAPYSKAQTKETLIKIVKKNPEDPPIDISYTGRPSPVATPEEMRTYLKLTRFTVTSISQEWFADLIYRGGKWSVR